MPKTQHMTVEELDEFITISGPATVLYFSKFFENLVDRDDLEDARVVITTAISILENQDSWVTNMSEGLHGFLTQLSHCQQQAECFSLWQQMHTLHENDQHYAKLIFGAQLQYLELLAPKTSQKRQALPDGFDDLGIEPSVDESSKDDEVAVICLDKDSYTDSKKKRNQQQVAGTSNKSAVTAPAAAAVSSPPPQQTQPAVVLSPEAAAEAAFDSFRKTDKLPEETQDWPRECWMKLNILLTRNTNNLTTKQSKQLDSYIDAGFAKTKPR